MAVNKEYLIGYNAMLDGTVMLHLRNSQSYDVEMFSNIKLDIEPNMKFKESMIYLDLINIIVYKYLSEVTLKMDRDNLVFLVCMAYDKGDNKYGITVCEFSEMSTKLNEIKSGGIDDSKIKIKMLGLFPAGAYYTPDNNNVITGATISNEPSKALFTYTMDEYLKSNETIKCTLF